MTYVMSDIHGNYSAFQKMLREIRFSDDDLLYIAGDLVDYGSESMELICDISMRTNVYCVVGDHDLEALKMLAGFSKMLTSGAAPDPEFAAAMKEWVTDGGAPTLEGFRKLDADMREGVLDYLSDMALFEEITVKEQDYVIVHAGIRNFSENTALDDLAPEDFIYESLDPDREYYEDKTIIAGHIHTNELPDPDPDMIYYGNGTIFLDCGSDKNGTLGCLCLDNGKEYYVR